MKRLAFILIVLFLPISAWSEPRASLGKITYLSGKVRIKGAAQAEWQALEDEMQIHERDTIRTGAGARCEISFQKKKVIRIDENSDIEITGGMAGEDKVAVSEGEVWLSVLLPAEMESAITLETPSSLCSIRGTIYRVSCNDNQSVYRCYQGKIQVESTVNKGWTWAQNKFLVDSGEEFIIVIDFERYKREELKAYKRYADSVMDDFERYKLEQQQSFSQMLQEEWSDFNKANGYYFKQMKFDRDKDKTSDWVQWNMERDRELVTEE